MTHNLDKMPPISLVNPRQNQCFCTHPLQSTTRTSRGSGGVSQNQQSSFLTDPLISETMIRILREESQNLKEQNTYLLGKLRIFSDRQTYQQEATSKFEGIIRQLNFRNSDLQEQLRQLTYLTEIQMQQLGRKINSLTQDTQVPKKQQRGGDWMENPGDKDSSQSNSTQNWGNKEVHNSKETRSSQKPQLLDQGMKRHMLEAKEEIGYGKRKDIMEQMLKVSGRIQQARRCSQR